MGAGPDRPENESTDRKAMPSGLTTTSCRKCSQEFHFLGFGFVAQLELLVGGVDLLTAVVAILFIVPKINPFQSN